MQSAKGRSSDGFMPIETQGRDRKLARPYHGPYRVLNITPTNVEVSLIDRPIFVSLDRVTPCYPELGDSSWTGHRKRKAKSKKCAQNTDQSQSTGFETPTDTGHRPGTTHQSKV